MADLLVAGDIIRAVKTTIGVKGEGPVASFLPEILLPVEVVIECHMLLWRFQVLKPT